MNTINDLSFVTADKVSLTDSYLANALSKEVSYLLSFDSDRWLAGFRETAGLDTLGKERYPGWEEMLIAGHAFGHFIGACSYAYLSPDITKEQKDRLVTSKINTTIDCITKALLLCLINIVQLFADF